MLTDLTEDALHAQLEEAQAEALALRAEVARRQDIIDYKQSLIDTMEGSVFWRLRQAWVRVGRAPWAAQGVRGVARLKPLVRRFLARSSSPVSTSATPAPGDQKAMFSRLYRQELEMFLAAGRTLTLPTVPVSAMPPVVSVLLILYNRADLTFQCLRSLCEDPVPGLEIVIVDNASTDETPRLLERLSGARIVRNAENVHFLRASNEAAAAARGETLLFLNNDARVLPGSIQAARTTLGSAPDIGAVGGKVLLTDGTLQEAGSLVWRDGSCLGYGRGDDPQAPPYNFRRDVDYCSGAFLLTPRALFLEGGGFSEDYHPAYYEETDYCLRLWESGKRVVYDPDAVITHFEFASAVVSETAIRLQADHQAVFRENHAARLGTHLPPDARNVLLARTPPSPAARRVLFLEDRVPHASLGLGFPRSREVLLSLLARDCQVTLYPLAKYPGSGHWSWDVVYQDLPKTFEAMMGWGAERLASFLGERAGFYDLLLVSRPTNMRLLQPLLAAHPEWFADTVVVYDAEALFALREVAQRRLEGKTPDEREVQALIAEEVALVRDVDAVVAVSEAERVLFPVPPGRSHTLGHVVPVTPTPRPWAQRRGILFVGAIFDGSPNADSVLWFAAHVLPRLRAALGEDVPFTVVGQNLSDAVLALADGPTSVVGRVDDLTPYYDGARVFIAPTRFAAGIPHKVHSAAAHGLPVVGTPLIAAQLGWNDGEALLVAEDPDAFAAQCLRLHSDPDLWGRVRDGALARVARECSADAFEATLDRLLATEKKAT